MTPEPVVTRHGKPSKAYTATLRKPSIQDYDRLTKACVEAILSNQKDLIVSFGYTFKFPAGFPRGILESKDGASNYHRIKANKLLAWLHESGHTSINMEMIWVQRVAVAKMGNEIENMFE